MARWYEHLDIMSLSPANNFNIIDLVSEGRPKTDFQILYDKPVKKTFGVTAVDMRAARQLGSFILWAEKKESRKPLIKTNIR